MTVTILKGDCRDVLRSLPSEIVHCVVTSPPYWGLRDYGVEGQIGLEAGYPEFVDKMVDVFRDVRRVLRKDGTLWLNMGDSYSSQNPGSGGPCVLPGAGRAMREARYTSVKRDISMLKPKDLCGIPWRVAFALQADGWWLRQDIIWSKPNPMPESVTDRCTKAHEYIFMLTKSARYYYDADAVREPYSEASLGRYEYEFQGTSPGRHKPDNKDERYKQRSDHQPNPNGRNRRSVWTVTTEPFSEAHFATFPPALIEPCILAGCPKECCAKCGAPWMREVEREAMVIARSDRTHDRGHTRSSGTMLSPPKSLTLGFSPSCSCNTDTVAGTVLDPFGGAGTTGLVADRHGRNAILIELNPEYAAMAERRIRNDAGLFAQVAAE